MAIIKKEFDIAISKNTLCPKGAAVVGLAKGLAAGDYVKIKTVIGSEMVNGKWPVYIDSEEKPNLYGLVDKVSGSGELDNEDIGMLAEEKKYEIRIASTDGAKKLNGKLLVLLDESAAARPSGGGLAKELDELASGVVAAGLVSRTEMDERLKVMKENGVDECLQIRVLRQYRKYNKPVHRPSCIFKDPYLEDTRKRKQEGIISEGLRAALSGHAVILEGEKSVGKNVYAETVTWLLGKPMYLITFSRQMSPSSIYGEKTTGATCSSTSL